MKVYIKNMVCRGTRFFVLSEMGKLGIKYNRFESGEIDLEEDITLMEIKSLDHALREYGLEVMFSKNKLVSKIFNTVHDLVEKSIALKAEFSSYISNRLGYDYDYLNNCFSHDTGLRIKEYYIEKHAEKMRDNDPGWSDEYSRFEICA